MTWVSEHRLRILVWHAHGSWTSAFVRGRHEYLLPALPGGGPWGLGRADRAWPNSAREVKPADLGEPDLVVLQRPEELDLLRRWTGLRAGRDVPAVYVEHNTPTGDVPRTRHFLAEENEIPIVQVTHFNRLMWDTGRAPVEVIEHGVVDPGFRYTGEERSAGVVINEPVRRGRATGTDLLPAFARVAPLDVYGMGVEKLDTLGGRIRPHGDLGQEELHTSLARRRLYLHTPRWTSLGLSLVEAMHLGMPVVALACTEAVRAVPLEAGFVSADVAELAGAVRALIAEPDLAHRMGKYAREFALANYGLEAFLHRWDKLLHWVTGGNR
ncbi:MAG TPA: glycosyltransferase [Amycolatopsis sp.]|uniref:glycosyltransferase n=1 Tax=Amycolatopsis sp. TaxID=37632 RepID=UPI002B458E19|nr:glycosyltransferase [Amycolatopsis sp.]HKS47901.1 glycosyltransferase [Amycolatopsis sp.]